MKPITCIVPARMSSSRFPGKPLVDIGGLPMVVRSARRAIDAGCFAKIVVATEDPVIIDACKNHGLETILTPSFPTGTDRVAWAAQQLDAPWVLNLQGDEPVFPLELLRDLCQLLPTDPDALWTAADTGLTESDRTDDDVVKIELSSAPTPPPLAPEVPCRSRGAAAVETAPPEPPQDERMIASALDFFRQLPTDAGNRNFAIHVGVYGGSLQALSRFASLPVPEIEILRRIEPLRALSAGMPVNARTGHWPRVAVDRAEHVRSVMESLRKTSSTDSDGPV